MIRKKMWILVLFFFTSASLCYAASSFTADNTFILPQYSKRISLDFKDADIKDVLKVFSQQIGSNFIVSAKVRDKKVTVFLDKVPVEEALSKILIANGLFYHFDQGSNIIMVEPKDETERVLTRVYPLKYATVPSSKVLSTFQITDESSSSSSGSSSSSTSASSSTNSSTTGGILDAVMPVLSKTGKIAVDERTNSLIITDLEKNFSEIEQTVAKLDVPIPQVLIQVEMIDTSKAATEILGVQLNGNIVQITGIKAQDYFHQFKAQMKGATVGSNAAPGTNLTYSTMGISGVMEFLNSRTDTKVLARPRILTMDNQMAQIKISANEVVGVTRTTSGTTGTSDVTETAERMETGVILTVTPQVNLLSGDIMMAVSPKVIDIKPSLITGTQTKFYDPETRGAKVMMRVHDGETIVLGGLLRNSKETTLSKVPLLGDIPFIGALFRHKNEIHQDRELLIFITPHILSGDGVASAPTKSFIDMNNRESSSSGRSQEIEFELDRASMYKNQR